MARDLDARLFDYACRMVDLYGKLEAKGGAAQRVAAQLFDSGTAVGANYAEAGAGQSKPDFISKISIARKECRESLFWLRLVAAKALLPPEAVAADISEAIQLTAILTAIVRNARLSSKRGPE